METNVVIIVCVVAVVTAIILGFSTKDIQVTIKMEEDDYPLKSDGVEELEVKPKRKYKKRKKRVSTEPVVKRPVGRPRKAIY